MVGSIAQGHVSDGHDEGAEAPANDRWTLAVGIAIALVALAIYVGSNPERYNFYEHFTWQASAWLHGQTAIRFPVPATADSPGNAFYLDVLPVLDANGNPTGRALIPFPPLPAVVELPFVAIWGVATNAQLLAAFLGGLDVYLAFWMLGRLAISLPVRAAVTIFFAVGTVFWYTAMLGTTWYFAHVVAVGVAFLAVGVALGADRDGVRAAVEGARGTATADVAGRQDWQIWPAAPISLRRFIDPRQFLAGFLLGLASTARLTVILGAPFLVFVGGGGSIVRRTVSAGLGAAIPVLGLLAYNVATTGHLFHPAYEYLYQLEANGYQSLGYHPDWSIEDVRYVPQNLVLMLGGLPSIMPVCSAGSVRGFFNPDCPYIVPQAVGMSLLLTSPGYLLAVPAFRRLRHDRIVVGAAAAILAIAFVNLMHFSQGWVQFGYRFSNDFVAFSLVLVALGVTRLARTTGRLDWRVYLLIGVSIAINLWGVVWGRVLGW